MKIFANCGIASIVVMACLSGCGSRSNPEHRIEGTVFFHNSPLPGGMIVFIPDIDHGGSGSLVVAPIDSRGTFSVEPNAKEPLTPGWYRITVAAEPQPEVASMQVSLFRGVPARYRNPKLSQLRCELHAGRNRIDVYLEDY